MNTLHTIGRLSTITFATDMTLQGAPEIPLGFMLEATWPDDARWLGIIGRTKLTTDETLLINFNTWPEMHEPFELLDKLFGYGWDADWGTAGEAAQSSWLMSALRIKTIDASDDLKDLRIMTDAEWSKTIEVLKSKLSAYGEQLKPYQPSSNTDKRRPSKKRDHGPHLTHMPTGMRVQEDIKMAA